MTEYIKKLDCAGTSDVCKQVEIKAYDVNPKKWKPVPMVVIRNGKATIKDFRTVK